MEQELNPRSGCNDASDECGSRIGPHDARANPRDGHSDRTAAQHRRDAGLNIDAQRNADESCDGDDGAANTNDGPSGGRDDPALQRSWRR